MTSTKTVPQRERELQSLLATPAGRKELLDMEARYQAVGGTFRPEKSSIITYLLVHERNTGLIGT